MEEKVLEAIYEDRKDCGLSLLPWHEDLLQSHGAFTEEDL